MQPLKPLHFKLKTNLSDMLEIRFLTVVVLPQKRYTYAFPLESKLSVEDHSLVLNS